MATRRIHISLLPGLLMLTLLWPHPASAQAVHPPALRTPKSHAAISLIALIGHVQHPGVYAMEIEQLSVGRALARAGGLTANASGHLRIIRNGQSGISTYVSPQAPETSVPLQHGDVIVADAHHGQVAGGTATGGTTGSSGRQDAGAPAPHNHSVPDIAIVNLVPRPVVVPVTGNFSTVAGLIRFLQQSPAALEQARLISSPQQHLARRLSGQPLAEQTFVTGDVLVLQASTIDVSRIPVRLPPVVQRRQGQQPDSSVTTVASAPAGRAVRNIERPTVSSLAPGSPAGPRAAPAPPSLTQPPAGTSGRPERTSVAPTDDRPRIAAQRQFPGAAGPPDRLESWERTPSSEATASAADASPTASSNRNSEADSGNAGSIIPTIAGIGIACIALVAVALWWKHSRLRLDQWPSLRNWAARRTKRSDPSSSRANPGAKQGETVSGANTTTPRATTVSLEDLISGRLTISNEQVVYPQGLQLFGRAGRHFADGTRAVAGPRKTVRPQPAVRQPVSRTPRPTANASTASAPPSEPARTPRPIPQERLEALRRLARQQKLRRDTTHGTPAETIAPAPPAATQPRQQPESTAPASSSGVPAETIAPPAGPQRAPHFASSVVGHSASGQSRGLLDRALTRVHGERR